MKNQLTDISGLKVKVGHAHDVDVSTGVTVFVPAAPALGGCFCHLCACARVVGWGEDEVFIRLLISGLSIKRDLKFLEKIHARTL
ncbi:MAG: hypothetical protein L3J05_07405 [Robiginitomaculum sp.]|nr:hypothetical protein [Robiginitomaculum sp.]